jgi:predicted ATPase
MLTRLHLRNFKSWSHIEDVDLRPITGLFGTNSSGKTSLLQALLLLKQTSESSDRGLVFHFGDKTTAVDLGDFRSVVHGHNTEAELGLGLAWEAARPFDVIDTKDQDRTVLADAQLGFAVGVSQTNSSRGQRLLVNELSYRVGSAVFGLRRKPKVKLEYELYAEGTDFRFIHSVGRKWPLPPPVKSYGFPDQVRAYFQNAGFLADLELALEERLRHVYYLGPLRAYPERRYTWAGAQPIDMGRAGESVVDALLASRERGETISPGYKLRRLTLEAYVAQWLKKLGLIHDFRVVQLAEGSQVFEVKVRKSPGAAEVLITDVGFGVSQILPVLVLCFYVPPGSTVILEQPEIHLHPAVQAGLADVIIDAWKKRSVQILVESHSEHFLRRLQRRVADETMHAEDIGLFFCSTDEHGSKLTSLDLDLFGTITNWPKDFFGDEFGEIAAMSKAAQERKQKAAE